jgi:hypothetical protein
MANDSVKPRAKGLPQPLFDLVPALLPDLAQVFAKCGATPPVIFALTYLKHYGRDRDGEQKVILRSELVENLQKMLHDKTSKTSMSQFITDLANAGLVNKTFLTEKEKRAWYGDPTGRKDAVILTAEGFQKIEEFKSEINNLFIELTAGTTTGAVIRAALKPFLKTMGPVARMLIRSIHRRSRQRQVSNG